MKKLVFTTLLMTIISHSKGEILTFDSINTQMAGTEKVKAKPKTNSPNNGKEYRKDIKVLRDELKETRKKLDSYRYVTGLQMSKPFIMKEEIVGPAEIIGATTQLSIRATPQPSTVLLTDLKGSDLPADAKIECEVVGKYKRICGQCSRLILDGKSHQIRAELRNRDGSNCAIGELSDDGETYMVGVAFSELAQGALAISQTSIPTVGGNLIENSASNKLRQGAINLAGEGTEIFKERMRTQEPIVFLERGSQVAVYFIEGVNL